MGFVRNCDQGVKMFQKWSHGCEGVDQVDTYISSARIAVSWDGKIVTMCLLSW